MPSPALSPAPEAEAQELASRIRPAVDADALRLARLVVGTAPQDLFGQTAFDLRDIVLRSGASVYELYLAEKKTAMWRRRRRPPLRPKRRLPGRPAQDAGKCAGADSWPPRLLLERFTGAWHPV